MNIDQYTANLGYGEQITLNGRPYTHRGNDYPLVYKPVLIGGTEIGISGATGLVNGPHVHVQAGRDEWAQQTIDPTPYVGQPGEVVKTGSASQWGNYVCVRVGTVNVFYCHLSKITAQVGQKVGEEMPNDGDITNMLRLAYNNKTYEPTKDELERYKRPDWGWKKLAYDTIFGAQGKLDTLAQDLHNATWIADERLKQINELMKDKDSDAEETLNKIREILK